MAVALVDHSLVTAEEASAFMKKALPTGSDLDHLHLLMNAVADELEEYVGRRLKQHGTDAAITELHSFRNRDTERVLRPLHFPIGAVTSLHSDADRVFDADALIAATKYVITGRHRHRIELIDDGTVEPFHQGVQTVQLVYTAGYEATGAPLVPNDLKLAALYVIADRANDAGYDGFGGSKFGRVEGRGRGGESITYEPRRPYPFKAKETLDRYQRQGWP